MTDRSQFIGGSDAAAVLGISPWLTPYQLWLHKVSPVVSEDTPATRRGKLLEPVVLQMLEEEHGIVVAQRNVRYFDQEHPFLASEVDAETADGTNIEIKTVSPFKASEWGDSGTDEIPVHYTAQAQHNLMVTGRVLCLFGVLIGDDLRTYRVERDDAIISTLRQREIEFWENVRSLTPPPPSNLEDVAALFPLDNGESVEADETTEAAYRELVNLRRIMSELEAQQDVLVQQIQTAMGAASSLTGQGRTLAMWKAQKAVHFDQNRFRDSWPGTYNEFTKESEYRVFRLKGPKKDEQ